MNEKFYRDLKKYQDRYKQIIIDYETMRPLSFPEVRKAISAQRYMDFFYEKKAQYNKRASAGYEDRNIEDDDNHGIPAMNQVFYRMLLNNKKLPAWRDYLNEYKNTFCHVIDSLADPKMRMMTFKSKEQRYRYVFQECSLDYKLLKGYMSFLKEVYILFWLWDKHFVFPYYSLHMDFCGYDILCRNMYNRLYGIRVYASSKKAREFAQKKKDGRSSVPMESTSITVVVPIDDRATEVGDTYVSSDETLQSIMQYINNNITADTKFGD